MCSVLPCTGPDESWHEIYRPLKQFLPLFPSSLSVYCPQRTCLRSSLKFSSYSFHCNCSCLSHLVFPLSLKKAVLGRWKAQRLNMGRCTCSRAIYSFLLVYQNTFINENCAVPRERKLWYQNTVWQGVASVKPLCFWMTSFQRGTCSSTAWMSESHLVVWWGRCDHSLVQFPWWEWLPLS